MIYYMLCINSQPLCHVINVYINAQMIILMINAILMQYLWDYYPLYLYSLLLSTESWS